MRYYTTSPKEESFPSKERPLLGRLESRGVCVRESCISMDACSLLTVDFGTPSYKFTINIRIYLIF
jgi:hypothetical protein